MNRVDCAVNDLRHLSLFTLLSTHAVLFWLDRAFKQKRDSAFD